MIAPTEVAAGRDGVVHRLRNELALAVTVQDSIGSDPGDAAATAEAHADNLRAIVEDLEQCLTAHRLLALRVLSCDSCGYELGDTSTGSEDVSARGCPACGHQALRPVRVDLFDPERTRLVGVQPPEPEPEPLPSAEEIAAGKRWLLEHGIKLPALPEGTPDAA